jgi:hypothetical protein
MSETDTNPEPPVQTSFPDHPITLLNGWPLPTSVDGVEELWEANEHLQYAYDEPPHPDELHEQFVTTLCEQGEWRVQTIGLYGYAMQVYFWNHLGGYGFSMSNGDGHIKELRALFNEWASENTTDTPDNQTAMMQDDTEQIKEPAVEVHQTHKGDWEAVYVCETPAGIVAFQEHGDTIPEALRALAESIEGRPNDPDTGRSQ